MAKARRKFYVTEARLKVLRALREANDPLYGAQITEACELTHGTVYPILHRFVRQGWVVTVKEPAPRVPGRPRIYYRLTSEGHRQAVALLKPY